MALNGNSEMGFSGDNLKGFILALMSSVFIGASFIIKKKGLRRAAATSGIRAGKVFFFLLLLLLFNFFGGFLIFSIGFVFDS